jgi:endonuclease G
MGLSEAGRSQDEAAAERVERRREERLHRIDALGTPGQLAEVEDPGRIAKRLDRLSRYYAGEELPETADETPAAAPEEVLAAAVERGSLPRRVGEAPAQDGPAVVLERIINTPDFVDIRYLQAGVAAAGAVCRIRLRDQSGRVVGHGSGSLVSPRLLLTNHHVLETSEVAALSAAEFNFQDGLDGQPLQPRLFHLDPSAFFVADEERDFALVAVRAAETELAEFGFNPLVEAEGKAVVGEFVTIVQHPGGEKKQVSLRENRIVDLPEAFMHYEADTEPGSSGSPVFNDQWEVVALHHASVRAPDQGELGGFVNEGVRISRILAFLAEQQFEPEQQALLDGLRLERVVIRRAAPDGPGRLQRAPSVVPHASVEPQAGPISDSARFEEPGASVSLPLELTLRVTGTPAEAGSPSTPPAGAEAIVIDPDYDARGGYDPDFLGARELSVPLPVLSEELLAKTATASGDGDDGHVLTYHNFSVVMNRERRLAFYTVVMIDGSLSLRLKREADRWFLDPRIDAEDQTGEPVYADNDLDRGHLVRRLDPAWGGSEAMAKLANDDTFHFTNCTPQHKNFNQNQTTWAGLEDYILENADNRDFKVTVFTGPVFAEDDDEYRGVMLPRQFWKVAVMVKESGQLSATAYLLSQESLIEALEVEEEFSYGAYRTYQVQVAQVEGLTGLSFGSLKDHDPLAVLEAAAGAREVKSERELVL